MGKEMETRKSVLSAQCVYNKDYNINTGFKGDWANLDLNLGRKLEKIHFG